MAVQSVDANKLDKKLNLTAVARTRGKRELPRSSEKHPDSFEAQIEEEIRGEIQKTRSDTNAKLTACMFERYDALSGTQYDKSLRGAQNALEGLRETAREMLEGPRKTREQLDHYGSELKLFRDSHDLESRKPVRLLSYPRFFGFTFGLGTFETIVGHSFFSDASDHFWQALMPAAAYSFMNIVLIGIFFGFVGTRKIYSQHVSEKLLGAILLLLFIFVMVSFNSISSHYRHTVTTEEYYLEISQVKNQGDKYFDEDYQETYVYGRPYRTAWLKFKENPVNFRDFTSWLMFGMGCIFSILALWKSWEVQGSFPEYQRRYNNYRDRLRDHLKQRSESVGVFSAARTEVEQKILELKNLSQKNEKIILESLNTDKSIRSEYEIFLRNAEHARQVLVQRYRSLNREERSTEEPEYFDTVGEAGFRQQEEFQLQSSQYSYDQWEDQIATIRQHYEQHIDGLNQDMEKLSAEFLSQLNKLY